MIRLLFEAVVVVALIYLLGITHSLHQRLADLEARYPPHRKSS